MNQTKTLVKKITEGIQEKKGKNIVVADLTEIDDTICKYFIICEGNTPTQLAAIRYTTMYAKIPVKSLME